MASKSLNNWHEMTLGEFVSLQRGHDLPGPERRPGEVPIMGSFGLTGYHDTAKRKGPGVTIGRSGASFGVVSFCLIDYWPLNTALYVTDFHGNDERFAYYFLKTIDFSGFNSGSAQPSLNRNFIHPMPIKVPLPPEQRTIAHILGALDDKIDLNRRMNATLERMARALFQAWFVDFEPVRAKARGLEPPGLTPEIADLFPDSLEESETGEIPRGWPVRAIDDYLTLFRDSVDPRECLEEDFEHFSIPAFDANQRPAIEAGESIKSQKILVPPNCVLVSKLNPRTPRVWLPSPCRGKRQIASTEFLVCVGKRNVDKEFLFGLATSDSLQQHMVSHASGTSNSHQRVRAADFLFFKFACPPPQLMAEYCRITRPMFEEINTLKVNSATLGTIRDTLLPKLMSGELRITDLEGISGRWV